MYDFSHVDVNTYSYPSLDQLDSLQVLGEIQATSNKHVNQTDLYRNRYALSCSGSDSGNTQLTYVYTVDGSEIQRSPVEVGSLSDKSHYLGRV